MTYLHDIPSEPESVLSNEQFMADLFKERDDIYIPLEYIDATVMLLNAVEQRNNPDGSQPKKFHNLLHHRDVMGFGVQALDLMKYDLHLDVTTMDYALLIVEAAAHDLFNDTFSNGTIQVGTFELQFGDITLMVENDGTKTDERLSAEAAGLLLNKLGFPKTVQRRVGPAIMMTEMTTENGIQKQKNAGRTKADYAAVALAIGDTLGIALRSADDVEKGIEKAKSDIPRLAAELLGGETQDKEKIMATLDRFSRIQPAFITQSITDAAENLFALVDDPERRRLVHEKIGMIRRSARKVIQAFEMDRANTNHELLKRYFQLFPRSDTANGSDKKDA